MLIGAVALVTALTALLFFTAESPLKVDAKTISKNIMAPIDYNFSMVYSASESSIDSVTYPIFNASADCKQDVELAKLIDGGELLASADMDDQTAATFAGQDVVRFKSSEEVDKFVQLVRDGYANEHCSYNSKSLTATFGSEISGLDTAVKYIEVGGSRSVGFTNHVTIDAPAYDWHIDFTQLVVVIPAGDTVVVLTGTVSKDGTVGLADMQKSLKNVAEKAFGLN